MSSPILSVVIANYNYGRFLEEAIRSIIEQRVGNQVELIICDGGSTDNSVEIIRKYSDKVAWWCSEPDNGQSAAFNKGFSHAKGKYLTWLNADDVFIRGSLSRVLCEMRKYPECDWFTGNMLCFLENGKIVEVGYGPRFFPKILQRPNAPVVAFSPSTFFSRRIYELSGGVDERLNYVMDPALWKKFMKIGIKQRRLHFFCWAFRMHEASKTAEYKGHSREKETAAIAHKETAMVDFELGYKVSKLLRLTMYLIRIIDGSFAVKMFGRILIKRFNVKDQAIVFWGSELFKLFRHE